MLTLKNPYIAHVSDGLRLYGGNQNLMKNQNTRLSGCGVIAALDTLIYMHLYHSGCDSDEFCNIHSAQVSHDEYEHVAESLRRKYLPVVPRFGTNGFMLSAGMNAFMKKHNIPYRASYGTKHGQLFNTVEAMIGDDLPVILLIGASFPAVWVKDPLNFYIKSIDGIYKKACAVSSHYVTITGIDSDWLCVSSWGKQYYISKEEFIRHSKAHSIELFNTIIKLTPRQKND